METTITLAQRIRLGDELVTVVGGPVRNIRQAIANALDEGKASREPAGPGWGSHNAIIRVGAGAAWDCYSGDEPEYGDWLVTILDA